MTKKKQKTDDMIATIVYVGVFCIFLSIPGYFMIKLSYDFVFEEYIQRNAAMNDFCHDNYVAKYTDYRFHSKDAFATTYKIDCDGKIVIAIISTPCLEHNKWGDCTEHGYSFCKAYDYSRSNITGREHWECA